MKTEDKILIGLSAAGVSLAAIIVAINLANQPVPLPIAPVAPNRARKPELLYNVVEWYGPDGPTQPTSNELHRMAPELQGGLTGANNGKGLGQAQGPSERAFKPMLIGGTQGYASGPPGNPVPTGVTLY